MTVANVFITGMHSGPNPSPGLGVARSLRLAHPELRLVGVDYSATSSGMHAAVLDDIVCMPSWSDVHTDTWAAQLLRIVDDTDTVVVPNLDLEVRLLAEVIGEHERILAPARKALSYVTKPPAAAAVVLGLRVPESLEAATLAELERFVRHSPHGIWVKGPQYEAFHCRTVQEAVATGEFIESVWDAEWHAEAHVVGQECGLAFCAVDGQLIDAVLMAKVLLTGDGKTWSGEVCETPDSLLGNLAEFTAQTGWTGGGEIEMIRSWSGEYTLMEINPRFPAWVHGATVSGANLPAALVDRATRRRFEPLGPGFTRVVEEIPVDRRLGVLPFPWGPSTHTAPATKNPSGMRRLAHRGLLTTSDAAAWTMYAAVNEPITRPSGSHVDAFDFTSDLPVPTPDMATPLRILLPGRLRRRITELRTDLDGLPRSVVSYSVKTAPEPRLLSEAAALGLAAEAITLDELDAAVAAGFDPGRAVLNGPAKWWPEASATRCWAFFADSIRELELLEQRLSHGFELSTAVVGVRLAPVGRSSRFGIDLTDVSDLRHAAQCMKRLSRRLDASWGVHFHYAESTIGPERWRAEAASTLSLADSLADELGTPPAVVDIGGGWHIEDRGELRPSIVHLVEQGPQALRDESALLVLEPGKLLTQDAAAVVTRALVRSGRGGSKHVVVDAGVGDLPEAPHWAHPVARFAGDAWIGLGPGQDRILGRSCMEADILARAVDLSEVNEGDWLAFGMCGGYDLSMAYPFGRGEHARGLAR